MPRSLSGSYIVFHDKPAKDFRTDELANVGTFLQLDSEIGGIYLLLATCR